MSTYGVTVTRDDEVSAWVAVVDGLPPNVAGATQVERFGDLDLEVRDLIAGLTDADPDTVDLNWCYRWGEQDVTALLVEYAYAEQTLETATQHRDELRRTLITRGQAAGLSQRVLADALGLSHQRVHQIAHTASGHGQPRAPRRARAG